MKKDFTRDDLRTGMKVITRDNNTYLVALDTTSGSGLANYNHETHIPLNDTCRDLTSNRNKDKDIIEVWDSINISDILDSTRHWEKIWERPATVRELTMAEVNAQFGCECKIVE